MALDGPPEGPLAALNAGRWHFIRPLWRFARDIQRAARECDAALAHWTVPSGVLARCVGLPTVGVATAVMSGLERAGLSSWVNLRGVVAVSAAARNFGDVLSVTPMGVHASRFEHAPRGVPPRRLLCGSLGADQGVWRWSEATARLSLPQRSWVMGPNGRVCPSDTHTHTSWAHDLLPHPGPDGGPRSAGRPVVGKAPRSSSQRPVRPACRSGLGHWRSSGHGAGIGVTSGKISCLDPCARSLHRGGTAHRTGGFAG